MALEKITMPKLGESVTEGTITGWLVARGDHVNKYDPLAEVQTDKVSAEIPSSFAGKITELVAEEGKTIAVGELICYIETESDEIQEPVAIETPPSPAETAMKKRYSPAVLRLAAEHDVNLEQMSGTGKGGRITRKDVEKLVQSGSAFPEHTVTKPEESHEREPIAVPQTTGDLEIPVTGIRKAIAANMVQSQSDIPHAWMMVEVDVTNLVSYRDSLKTAFKQREGYNLTYFAFFVKAITRALTEYPVLNSMWAGDKIIQKKDINISIAVGTDRELYVPVIKHADEKSIKGIAREIHELATKVRSGKFKQADMEGGTFTVNNTGVFGSIQSMGIINAPQAAILQVESIVKRPVVLGEGTFGIRDMVNLCLSLDHRILDGIICGQFLKRVKDILENITKENTPIS